MDHVVGAEQVDGQVLFDRGRVAEVVIVLYAGIVDEHVERLHSVDGSGDLSRVGDIERQGNDAIVRVGDGAAGTGVDPAGAPSESFFDEGVPDTTVGAGYQDRLVGDGHWW